MSSQDPLQFSGYPQFSSAPDRGPTHAPPSVANRLPALLLVLTGLIFLLALPYVAEQVSYGIARGRAVAEAEAARDLLASLPEGVNRFNFAAKAVEPSVVGVRMVRLLNRGQIADEWTPLRRTPVDAMEGQGSGVIVDKEGYIITNFHVINGASRVTVTLNDGRKFDAVEIVGFDPASDIAVLKINATSLVAAPWGDSSKLEVGDQLLAIGSPFGLAETVTAGILSAKQHRNLPVANVFYQDFLQTDAAVNPGNSGGPLVDLKGQVVGINTAIFGDRYQGISFAIPSQIAQDVYQRLRKGEKVIRGWLGVRMQDLNDSLAEKLKLPEVRGALVADVLEDSPAQKAGIQPGDVVVQWNDKRVMDINDLRFMVASSPLGAQIKVKVFRDGKETELTVTVGERRPTLGQ